MTGKPHTPVSRSKKKILLVEDDDLLRKSIQKFLLLIGYEVIGVESAEAALEAFERQTVDLLITDNHLAGFTGLDLVRTLRNSGVHMPIVLISGYVNDELKASAKDLGIDSVLSKPMVLRTLDGVLANALAQRQ